MAAGPNVILICVDQWRGDALCVAGHPVVDTPFLDELAMDGVRFSQAYSETPSCIPARAALHTGMNPANHGRVGYQDGVAWNYPTTLAGEFSRHGYHTHAVGKMHVFPERERLGFHDVVLHDGYLHFARRRSSPYQTLDDYLPWLHERIGPRADYFDHGVNCNSNVARPWDKEESLHPTNFVVTKGLEFLERRDPRKPFFLFLSFHRPHPPYDPPAWAFDQYLQASMPDVPVGDWVSYFDRYDESDRPDCMRGTVSADRLRRARAGYYGHMTHIDHQLKRLFEGLVDFSLEKDCWICFTSDHGELMGDHHFFRKALPYRGSALVPLIVRGPSGSGVQGGSVVDHVVALRDIMPTLLACANIEIPRSVDGESLVPLLRGGASGPRGYLHGEHTWRDTSLHFLTDGRAKYIWFSRDGHEQLFDIADDPDELHDRAHDQDAAAELDKWRSRLVRELTGREEGFTDGSVLIPGRPVTSVLSSIERYAYPRPAT